MNVLSPTLFATALLTGLVGGLHCTTMCGGFALSVMHRSGKMGTVLYTAGRLTTYAALGALGGGFGALLLPLEQVGAVLSAILLIWFAARLAGVVRPLPGLPAALHKVLGPLGKVVGRGGPFALGGLTALLPCGLVYAALALPVAGASWWQGALMMVTFGLGTAPALTALSLGGARLADWSPGVRRGLAAVMVLAGLWALWDRWPGQPDDVPACCRTDAES
jgi:uncharacterized protein